MLLRLRRLRPLRLRLRRLPPDLLPEPSLAVLLAGTIWVNFAISLSPLFGRFVLRLLLSPPNISGALRGDEKGLTCEENRPPA